ncbi:MAG TPA: S16 family serine protease [Nitrososphaera sp.]|jgi:predicted ATP-dependent protease
MSDAGGVSESKNRILVSIVIAASTIALLSYIFVSSELANRARLIEEQNLEIQQYEKAIAGQQSELAEKTARLAELDSELERLSADLSDKSQEAASLGNQLESASSELKSIHDQAALLESQITVLEDELRDNEQQIEELKLQNEQSKLTITHYGLGIDQDEKGVVFPLEIEIASGGTGTLSMDISSVEYEPSFQNAIRDAAAAASAYTGIPISDKDIIVRLAGDLPQDGSFVKVDGSSAGALIAGMIAAGLSHKEINSGVLVTGTISQDGTIGRIGSLEEKTDAAETFGVETVLVPKSQEFDSEQVHVIGVSDMTELMKYFAP